VYGRQHTAAHIIDISLKHSKTLVCERNKTFSQTRVSSAELAVPSESPRVYDAWSLTGPLVLLITLGTRGHEVRDKTGH
jgi:hypothetical protein